MPIKHDHTGAGTVTLKSPSSGTETFVLPNSDGTTGQFLKTDGSGTLAFDTPAGTGDVVGPGSSTDNAIVRFDSTTGKLVQDSSVTVDDSGNIATSGNVDGRDVSADGTKLDGIEALADVTNATNVDAAGAVMESDLINTSAGAGDAGKPVKLDANGHIDASMVSDGDIDHTSITNIGTNTHAQIDTHIAATSGAHGISAYGATLVDDADAATARTTLGVVIGTDVQAEDAGLTSIAGLTTAADKMIYTTALDTYAVTDLTAAGRAILDDADATAQRTTLGLVIGTDVQAYDSQLADVAGLATTDGGFIVGNGTNFVLETGATALTSIGGIGAATTDTLTNKTFDANGTGNSLSNVDVADLANGTDGELITWDATGAPATVAAGTSGQVLTSNGAGAAPTFQDAGAGSADGTPHPGFQNDLYYGAYDSVDSGSTQVQTADRVVFIPFYTPGGYTFTRIGVAVTSLDASSIVLGIYSNSDGAPTGSALHDAGTVSANTVGEKEITVSWNLAQGWYWLAAHFEGAPTMRADGISEQMRSIVGSVNEDENVTLKYQSTSYTGSLPSIGTLSTSQIKPLRIWLRIV